VHSSTSFSSHIIPTFVITLGLLSMFQPAIPGADEQQDEGSYFQLDFSQLPFSHRRYKRSLESVLDSQRLPLGPCDRARAEGIFDRVLQASTPTDGALARFDAVDLLRFSLQYNPDEQGRDNFLSYMLRNYDDTKDDNSNPDLLEPFSRVLDRLDLTVSMWSPKPPEWVAGRTMELARHLLDFFFLPRKFC
jgi:hypothetical protein